MEDKTTEQLEELTSKIEELTLVVRKLEKEIKDKESSTKEKGKNKGEKKLKIGDRVNIRNPRNGQASSGRVCRIGKEYVTVETRKGKVVRKSYNLKKVKSSSEEESLE